MTRNDQMNHKRRLALTKQTHQESTKIPATYSTRSITGALEIQQERKALATSTQ